MVCLRSFDQSFGDGTRFDRHCLYHIKATFLGRISLSFSCTVSKLKPVCSCVNRAEDDVADAMQTWGKVLPTFLP